MPIAHVWEFVVHPGLSAEFERRYGPRGAWAELFARAPGYLGTELLRDDSDAHRYVTVDRWRTHDDYVAFKATYGSEYAALDKECEHLCSSERRIGTYHVFAHDADAG